MHILLINILENLGLNEFQWISSSFFNWPLDICLNGFMLPWQFPLLWSSRWDWRRFYGRNPSPFPTIVFWLLVMCILAAPLCSEVCLQWWLKACSTLSDLFEFISHGFSCESRPSATRSWMSLHGLEVDSIQTRPALKEIIGVLWNRSRASKLDNIVIAIILGWCRISSTKCLNRTCSHMHSWTTPFRVDVLQHLYLMFACCWRAHCGPVNRWILATVWRWLEASPGPECCLLGHSLYLRYHLMTSGNFSRENRLSATEPCESQEKLCKV